MTVQRIELIPRDESYPAACSWWKRYCETAADWVLEYSDGTYAVTYRACNKHAPKMIEDWIGPNWRT